MSKKHTLLAIQNGFWFINTTHAEALGGLVATAIHRLSSAEHEAAPVSDKASTEALLDEKVLLISANRSAYQAKDLSFSNANAGSVAVISITGPMMKEDNCGDPGTKTYQKLLQSAYANPNIAAVVLEMDTPGGTVAGTQSLANVVASAPKPVVTLADDMMASAGYWVGMSSSYVMASSNTTLVGSIGTMSSFTDFRPVWEKMGVKFHDITADASQDKNASFAEARQSNYARYRNEILNPLNDQFLAAVKARRGDKLKLDRENTLSGKIYTGPDAVKHGLIDSIGDMNTAIEKAFELSESKPSQLSQPLSNMKIISLTASHPALLAICGASIEAGKDSADVELIPGLVQLIEAQVAKAASLEAELKTKTERITELEAQNPGASNSIKTGNETTGSLSASEQEVWNLPHNKAALNNPLFN